MIGKRGGVVSGWSGVKDIRVAQEGSGFKWQYRKGGEQ